MNKNQIIVILLVLLSIATLTLGFLAFNTVQLNNRIKDNTQQDTNNDNLTNDITENSDDNNLEEEITAIEDSNLVKIFEKRSITLEGSIIRGNDVKFTIELPLDVVITKDDKLTGGGGYIGYKIMAGNLDMKFGLPSESPSQRYIEKIKVFTNQELQDVYRITTNEDYVFYTNKFDSFIEGISYCNPDRGNSIDCANPSLRKSPMSQPDGDNTGFVVSCELRTEDGIKNCDRVVETIIFE